MRLGEMMQTRVVTVDAGEPAEEAWSRMRRHRIQHLVVTSKGEVAGVISERDLGGPRGKATRSGRKVEDLMSRRIVSATPTMTLRQAANLMRGNFVGSLPILDNDELVGIVTATDVLDELGRGSAHPTRQPESRALRMTESRKRAARQPISRQRASVDAVGRARQRKSESTKRAPSRDWIPKAQKTAPRTESPLVPIHIRAVEVDLKPQDREYIRLKLGRRLGKFIGSIQRVSVRTEDVNGPRGGIDRVCRIKVVLVGLPSVVFESRDASLRVAVDQALAGVERAVRKTLQRRRKKPLRRAA